MTYFSQKEDSDYQYLIDLNNDLKLFNNIERTKPCTSADAIADNALIELKDRGIAKNGESYAYSPSIFIEPKKLKYFSQFPEDEWIYLNIMTASASTDNVLFFLYDLKKVINTKSLDRSLSKIQLYSRGNNQIKEEYRWLIDTDRALDSNSLRIYAKKRSTGHYEEYTPEIYDRFREKKSLLEHKFKNYIFPIASVIERDKELDQLLSREKL